MEAGKEEIANKIITVGREIDKLGQGMGKVQEGQDQIKGGNGEEHDDDRTIKRRSAGNKDGIGGRKVGV